MKNVVGTPARGDNYFPRKRETARILACLETDHNLQIAAPRRIGKTSILWHLLDNHLDENIYVYTDTEHIDDEQAFYKRLLKEILNNEAVTQSRSLQRILKKGSGLLGRIKSINILGNGIDLQEKDQQIDYYQDLSDFLCGFQPDNHKKLVLLIDEFPQTILNIVERDNGETTRARHFLQSNRDLRLNPAIHPRIRFIYTGSVGLNHTVAAINSSAFVNDLNTVEVRPLDTAEAKLFLQQLLINEQTNNGCIDYLIQKVMWLIPFHLQLIVQEIIFMAREQKSIITEQTVDEAFAQLIATRNNNHFRHYQDRLRIQLKGQSLRYSQDILSRIAAGQVLGKTALADIALQYGLADNYKNILEMLEYDGYLQQNSAGIYHFISPLLSMWWNKAA